MNTSSNLSKNTYIRKLKKYIKEEYGTQANASESLFARKTTISYCCNGTRDDKKLAREMGYEVVKKVTIIYKPIQGKKQLF